MPHPWTVHVGDCGARREADGEGVTDLEFSESAFQHAAWPETTPFAARAGIRSRSFPASKRPGWLPRMPGCQQLQQAAPVLCGVQTIVTSLTMCSLRSVVDSYRPSVP